LLAHEIYDKFKENGLPANLLTGQIVIEEEGAKHTSCTIEMADLRREVDAALIDEFQLLGNTGRGWAWTRAFLGLAAKEVHLAGDPSALTLIQRLVEATGDVIVKVNKYERLSPLNVSPRWIVRLGLFLLGIHLFFYFSGEFE